MTHLLTRHWKIAILWALSLVAVGTLALEAQRGLIERRPAERSPAEQPTQGTTVVFGNDVGFRVERTKDGIAIGKVVVRVDGKWVDTLPPAR